MVITSVALVSLFSECYSFSPESQNLQCIRPKLNHNATSNVMTGAVLPEGWKEQGIKVFAPTGFLENAVRENVYAGNAMTRRAVYMYGDRIPKGPAGLIGCGLGTTTSTGQVALVNPTDVIEQSFTEHDVAGLKLKFQLTPGTEAPAEMNIHFPGLNALCMAENSSHNLHNIQTLRGALVRDARMWARYLDESISKFTGAATDPPTDVLFNSHHWPTWGADKVRDILISQRDMYTYLHDQTLRMLNVGMTGLEIAENFVLPESLETKWNLRGYYGSVSHNVKGIYTRYMGWYDGNPAHLWEHPPVQAGKRYVDCIGGTHAALEKARTFKEEGDLRFAATLLSHVVFADQDSKVAREELAAVFTELGQGAENGTWRNEYLCAALELTGAIQPTLLKISPESMIALNLVELVDSVAITIDGPKAAQHGSFSIELQVPDIGSGTGYLMSLSNGALTHREVEYEAFSEFSTDTATLTLWPTHEQLVAMLHDKNADLDTQGIKWTGNEKVLAEFFGLVTDQDPGFAIVTPEKPTTW